MTLTRKQPFHMSSLPPSYHQAVSPTSKQVDTDTGEASSCACNVCIAQFAKRSTPDGKSAWAANLCCVMQITKSRENNYACNLCTIQ